MAQSPLNPDQHISCLKVEVRGLHDAYMLIVTTNEDRTAYESRIFFYPEFPNREGQVLLELPTWLVDFTVASDGSIYAIAADGRVWQRSPANEISSQSLAKTPLSRLCGPVETETIVTVGEAGGVFVLTGGGWRDLPAPTSSRLMDVTALTEEDIYVCGLDGMLAHWDGRGWTAIDLATNVNLLSIAHRADGTVAVGGALGQVFVGSRTAGFEQVIGAEVAVYGLCPFRTGFLLAAPGFGIYFLEGATITPFKESAAPNRIAANGNVAMAAADGDVLVYTGKQWLSLPVY